MKRRWITGHEIAKDFVYGLRIKTVVTIAQVILDDHLVVLPPRGNTGCSEGGCGLPGHAEEGHHQSLQLDHLLAR